MKVTRLAALTAMAALAAACHSAMPTEPGADVAARPSFDAAAADGGNGLGSGNFTSDDGGNGLGSGNFAPGDEFQATTSGDSAAVQPGESRGGNGLGSGN